MGLRSVFLGLLSALVIFAVSAYSLSPAVFAVESKSQNYGVDETQFNAGLMMESCSDSYCAKVSIGDDNLSAGNSVTFDAIENNEPLLEVIIESGSSNLGVFGTTKTATKEMMVKIRNHMGNGYFLQIHGNPPSLEGYILKALENPAASQPGAEQFGINVVENTTPQVGKNAIQVTEEDLIFGEVTKDYSVPNLFKYVSGDTIAKGLSASGATEYTISMIINVANTTPAGHYWSDFSAIVIPSY